MVELRREKEDPAFSFGAEQHDPRRTIGYPLQPSHQLNPMLPAFKLGGPSLSLSQLPTASLRQHRDRFKSGSEVLVSVSSYLLAASMPKLTMHADSKTVSRMDWDEAISVRSG